MQNQEKQGVSPHSPRGMGWKEGGIASAKTYPNAIHSVPIQPAELRDLGSIQIDGKATNHLTKLGFAYFRLLHSRRGREVNVPRLIERFGGKTTFFNCFE